MPIADTPMPPPRKAGPGRPRTPKGPTMEDMKAQKYESSLSDVKDLLAAGLMMAGLDADAGAIQLHTDPVIPEYAKLAVEIEPFGAFLEKFDDIGGKYARLAMLSAPLVLQLLTNHGILRGGFGGMFNVQPPELLRAQVMSQKVKMAQAAQEKLRDAQDEANRLMQEMQPQEDTAA